MSDLSPFGDKCVICKKPLTIRDYLRDNKYCSTCEIERKAKESSNKLRRSSRLREKTLEKARVIEKERFLLGLSNNISNTTTSYKRNPTRSKKHVNENDSENQSSTQESQNEIIDAKQLPTSVNKKESSIKTQTNHSKELPASKKPRKTASPTLVNRSHKKSKDVN
ncbi:hypothetical protein QTN25_001339 [Entamoeba marina]